MGDWSPMTVVSLLKYHGLGNDFLISLHPAGLPGGDELDADFVTTVCDRHRGVGADGVIVARPPSARQPAAPQSGDGSDAHAPPPVRMELRNADGSGAETSGNGLACLGLALVDAGVALSRTVVIETVVGMRTVTVGPRSGACSEVRAEMGRLRVRPQPVDAALRAGWPSFAVDAGNPTSSSSSPHSTASTSQGWGSGSRQPGPADRTSSSSRPALTVASISSRSSAEPASLRRAEAGAARRPPPPGLSAW